MSGAAASASQEEIRAAQQQLGREMVRLRKGLGYSQTRLALKVEHARGTLHACEQGNRTLGSHELWQDIDDALGAGGALVRQRDEIAAMAAVAADEAVRAGVRAPGGRPLAGTVPGGGGRPDHRGAGLPGLRSQPGAPDDGAGGTGAGSARGRDGFNPPGEAGRRPAAASAARPGQARAAMPEFCAITRTAAWLPRGPIQAANWSAYGTVAAVVTGSAGE